MSESSTVSRRILAGFSKLGYTFDVYEKYPAIYNGLKDRIPKVETSFQDFDLNTGIGCEVICAAICHSINWDFLRRAVWENTVRDDGWLVPEALSRITAKDVEEVLRGYGRDERVRASERSGLLADIGEKLSRDCGDYESLFFNGAKLRGYEEIKEAFARFEAFSGDPAEKKFRLLIQCVSDYSQVEGLSAYYKPTIDYHVVRLYIRRGVVAPVRREALDFLLDSYAVRRESTVGALRAVCAESMSEISWITQVDVKTVSRAEWWVARTICINGMPDCLLDGEDSAWAREYYDRCPFIDICQARARGGELLTIDEPKYKGRSY